MVPIAAEVIPVITNGSIAQKKKENTKISRKAMIAFYTMIRLVLATILCLLVSFGAISKNQQASKLLNHVSQEHHEHQHSHGHKHVTHHDHHADDSDEPSQPNHSHNLEMSLLVFSMTASPTNNASIVSPLILIEKKIESTQVDLNLCHFSSAVFRPPIA